MDTKTFKNYMRSVAEARVGVQRAEALVADVQTAIDSMIPEDLRRRREEASTALDEARTAVQNAEAAARRAALEYWRATGEKQLPCGVQIRERKWVTSDHGEATSWTIEDNEVKVSNVLTMCVVRIPKSLK